MPGSDHDGRTADFGPWSRPPAGADQAPVLVVIGENATRLFGLTPAQRLERIAARRGLKVGERPGPGAAFVLANVAFVFDPVLLDWVMAQPGRVVSLDGRVALASGVGEQIAALHEAMVGKGAIPEAFEQADLASPLFFRELFKSEAPMLAVLSPATRGAVERAAYLSAYRGVSDLLTLHLWKGLAFHLMRAAAALRLTPNKVTLVGVLFCIAAGALFWRGAYWLGLGCAFVFMVLDTVDGKLARCTVASSRFGDVLDHGVDLIHPPLWWWAWRHGLGVEAAAADIALAVIIAGYAAQRALEATFLLRFGMQIHLWRRFDSRFKLITAQRNIQVVILLVSLAFQRPAEGLIAVAVWTVLCFALHLVRLGQALRLKAEGRAVTSWLSEA